MSLSLCRNRCPYNYVTATAVAVVVVVENSQSHVDFLYIVEYSPKYSLQMLSTWGLIYKISYDSLTIILR